MSKATKLIKRRKGLRKIDEQIGKDTHQIRQYTKKFIRRVQYTLLPCTEEELELIKTSFPEFLDKLGFKKLIPKAYVNEDFILYQCNERPNIFFDVRRGSIYVSREDYMKYKRELCNNQAHFTVRKIRDCAKHLQVDYVEIHYLKRRLRPSKPMTFSTKLVTKSPRNEEERTRGDNREDVQKCIR
jgi:hypothetical protein